MLRMSSSDSLAARGCMIGLLRLPDLKSCSCLRMYSGCCCASFGFAAMAELPSALWQEAQAWAAELNTASPLAGSGLAGLAAAGAAVAAAGASAARLALAATPMRAASRKLANNFISGARFIGAKPRDSTMAARSESSLMTTPSRKHAAPPSRATPAVDPIVAERERIALGWLHTAHFLTSAPQLEHLPPLDLPEIAFVGRSNAGKSTAINTLTQQTRLAFASKTPGRTQHINLFGVGKQKAD